LALAALSTLSCSRLGLASKLNGDLAIHDCLAVEFVDGALGLGRSGDIDEGIADWAGGTGIGWDRCGFAG
jgi:hypothetical protein